MHAIVLKSIDSEYAGRYRQENVVVDGYGRTGRLLLNVELMKAGYPPAIILKEDRLAYYDALDIACVSGDYTEITSLVAASVQRSLDVYLGVLGLRSAHEPASSPAPPKISAVTEENGKR